MNKLHIRPGLRVLAAFIVVMGASGFFMAQDAMASVLTQSYTLTQSNLGSGYSGPFGTVTVSLGAANSSAATITFDSNTSNGVYFTDGSSAAVNANGSASISGISGNAACASGTGACYSASTNAQLDGFGNFSNAVDTKGSFTNRSSNITFTLTRTVGTWADAASVLLDNSLGHLVGAHIGICNSPSNCTSFLTTGFATDPGVSVPEPSSLAILGFGLLALGWLGSGRAGRSDT